MSDTDIILEALRRDRAKQAHHTDQGPCIGTSQCRACQSEAALAALARLEAERDALRSHVIALGRPDLVGEPFNIGLDDQEVNDLMRVAFEQGRESGVSPCFANCGQPACQKLGCVRVYNADAALAGSVVSSEPPVYDGRFELSWLRDGERVYRAPDDPPAVIVDGPHGERRINLGDPIFPEEPTT